MEGPDTMAAVFMEPLQNTGGAFAPPEGYWHRVREICDRYDVLLVSDEVICAFGRLGHMFGSLRYGYQPDMITFAKGVTSGYAPLGGVMISDRDRRAVPAGRPTTFLQGQTFGAHPGVVRRGQRQPRPLRARRHLRPRAGATRGCSPRCSSEPARHPARRRRARRRLLPRDRARHRPGTKGAFTDEQAEWLLRGYLSPRLYEAGLICRADDRGEPVITLSPPLIAGPDEFEFIVSTLRRVLMDASDAFARR
jgi:adenosylmethionine-8-amino-7-oxononanoate aminotransferase